MQIAPMCGELWRLLSLEDEAAVLGSGGPAVDLFCVLDFDLEKVLEKEGIHLAEFWVVCDDLGVRAATEKDVGGIWAGFPVGLIVEGVEAGDGGGEAEGDGAAGGGVWMAGKPDGETFETVRELIF